MFTKNRKWIFRKSVVSLFLLTSVLCSCNPEKDKTPPVFTGLHDMTIYLGDTVSYRQNVVCTDDVDGEIDFQVDSSQVNLNAPGEYTVIYSATDSAGNKTEQSVRLLVLERPYTPEMLYERIDPIISERGLKNADIKNVCRDLYYYIKSILHYSSYSDKSDWIAEAYRGLENGEGDCFTYYAVARAFFDRLGYQYLTVQRSENARDTTHYWLLINVGTKENPAWYHWDCCPHYKEFPFDSCLVTDEELLSYNQKVADYYTFDMEKYPRTPEN